MAHAHVIRRLYPWPPPEPHWEAGYGPSCDVCGTKSFGTRGCFMPIVHPPKDMLCTDCRKAVADAREQRAYLASLV